MAGSLSFRVIEFLRDEKFAFVAPWTGGKFFVVIRALPLMSDFEEF